MNRHALGSDPITLHADKDGFVQETDAANRLRARVELKAEQLVVEKDIAMLARSRVTVSGHVKTAGGAPVSRARTALIGQGGYSGSETPAVLTDDEGYYK